MESTLLCIQIVLFHLSECFSYLNTSWSQHVRISDFQLYMVFRYVHRVQWVVAKLHR